MKRFVFPCIMLLILTAGCGGQKYVPAIRLTKTAPTIDAIAEFHDLYPAYPLLSEKETFGLHTPKTERVEPKELTRQVESELHKELDAAGGVFTDNQIRPKPRYHSVWADHCLSRTLSASDLG